MVTHRLWCGAAIWMVGRFLQAPDRPSGFHGSFGGAVSATLGCRHLYGFTSPGPIFFWQERVGLNKCKFMIYKFRTMIPNAEKLQEELLHLNEMRGPVFKIKNDPRVTRLGRVLRKTSIDEMPQLFNVFKGDMSLVGPRALSVRDYQHLSETGSGEDSAYLLDHLPMADQGPQPRALRAVDGARHAIYRQMVDLAGPRYWRARFRRF